MKRGYTLIEMMLYIAILVGMLAVIFVIISNVVRSERNLASARTIENSAIFGLERVTREIRQATSVDIVNSVLDVSPGKLVLNSTTSGGAAETVEFSLQNSILRLKINGVDQGALTEANTRVTRLIFSKLSSPYSVAVRTQVTLESGTSTTYRTSNFYTTTILRGSI